MATLFTIRRLLRMTTLTLGMSMFMTATFANDARVGNKKYTEYAQVLNVQPVYEEVYLQEPNQHCWTEREQLIVGYQNLNSRHVYPQNFNRRNNPRYNVRNNPLRPRGHRNNYRSQSRNSASGNAVIGGLIGGAIGNQLGRGHSRHTRTGSTIVGAILGSAIANESGYRSTRQPRGYAVRESSRSRALPIYQSRDVKRCKEVINSRTEHRLQHYRVTYQYKGHRYVTQTQTDPGDRIEIQVSVTPVQR